MSAASTARRTNPELGVVVLEVTAHVAYGLCGLPHCLSGVVGTAAVVTELDSSGRWVTFRQADRTFTVRTLNAAIALRGLLDGEKARSALVVGAGDIGLEMAEALAAQGFSVSVVERLGQVLPNLDPEPAAVVAEHARARVDLRLSADATLAGNAGAETGPAGALVVDAEMRTSLPGVWTAGDCVAPLHRVTRQPASVPLRTKANKTGRVAGTVAAGFPALATDLVHRSRAKYYPGGSALHARLGHGPAGRLLGAQVVRGEGAAHRIDVLSTALQVGMTGGDSASLDLACAPPYSPVYDPILIAAETAVRQIGPA